MIRFWEPKDSIQIRKFLKAFFESQIQFGAQALPSEFNVQLLLQLGYEQIAQGDPHLVYEEDEKVIGIIQMGKTLNNMELREKSAEVFSFYVDPGERRKFISIELMRKAGEIAASQGYKKISSMVHTGNERSWKNMFFNPAIWPIGIICEWRLEADPQFEGVDLVRLTERKVA